jgi:sn-glycerol 3-phosphate transport system substrate-binding protein
VRFQPRAVLFSFLLAVAFGGLIGSHSSAAPNNRVTIWHYLGTGPGGIVLNQLASEFNKSQSKYEIVPEEAGSFQDVQIRTIAGLRAGGLPSAAFVDNAFFTRLALGGQLADYDEEAKALPSSTLNDLVPVVWEYGNVETPSGQHRYGLPYMVSTVILYYNVDAFAAKGIQPPKTWEEFGKAAKAMTTRASKGAVLFTNAWIYSAVLASRGASLLTADKKPDFNSPASLETLRFLSDLTKAGALVPRTLNEASFAVLDFLRTKVMMVVVPTSAYPAQSQAAFAFKISAVPLPGRTIPGEAQLVTFKNTPLEAQRAVWEFWQYAARPENVARFSKESYYLPIRKSAVKLMGDVAQNPVMKAGLESLDRGYNYPHVIEFQDWRAILDDQLERCLKGGVDPTKALNDAQRAATK